MLYCFAGGNYLVSDFFEYLESMGTIDNDYYLNGRVPTEYEYNSSNGKIYVSNSDSGDVSVMDSGSNKVIHTIDAGDSPQFLKYNPSNGNI